MTETLRVDGLEFAVVRSPRRKTVGITVERDGGLSVAAPVALDAARVEPVVRGKLLWVYTKLAEQSLLFRQAAPREYVSGEGFHYLGRRYRLLLTEPTNGEPVQLRLTGGRLPLAPGADELRQGLLGDPRHRGFRGLLRQGDSVERLREGV